MTPIDALFNVVLTITHLPACFLKKNSRMCVNTISKRNLELQYHGYSYESEYSKLMYALLLVISQVHHLTQFKDYIVLI